MLPSNTSVSYLLTSVFMDFSLAECLQLKVVRVISGTLMTSLDMAGVSLTLMNLDTNAWLRYLGQSDPVDHC